LLGSQQAPRQGPGMALVQHLSMELYSCMHVCMQVCVGSYSIVLKSCILHIEKNCIEM